MSKMAKTAREAMKKKAARLANEKQPSSVDSSTFKAYPNLNADKQTGAKPKPRAFKQGGKVEGESAKMRADKVQRKGKLSGGALGRYAQKAVNDLDNSSGRAASLATKARIADEDFGDYEKAEALERKAEKVGNRANRRAKGLSMAIDKLSGSAKIPARKAGGRVKKANGGDFSGAEMPEDKEYRKKLEDAGKGNSPDQKAIIEGMRETLEEGKRRNEQRMLDKFKNFKSGGRTKKMDGGGLDPRLTTVPTTRMKFAGANQGTPYKKGGKVHDDEAMDKALIKKMVKPEARVKKFGGGALSDAYGDKKKSKGGKGKGKTNINIIISSGKDQAAANPMGAMPAMPPMPPAPPAGGAPGGMPPMPPMGGGAPGAFKKGGRVKKFFGGALGTAAGPMGGRPAMAQPSMGGGIGAIAQNPQALQQIGQALGGMGRPAPAVMPGGQQMQQAIAQQAMSGMGRPGIQTSTVPPAGRPDFAALGQALGGGRPAPMAMRKSGGRVKAKSFKDMDAGAGSGEGRLEKTEIQKSKRGR